MTDSSLLGGRKISSSPDLSDLPPESPTEGDSIVVLSSSHYPATTTTTTSTPPPPTLKSEPATKPVRKRKPRLAADGTEIVPKPRKSRAKKKDTDQTLPSTTTTATATSTPPITTTQSASTTKITPAASQSPAHAAPKPSKQSKISDLMSPAPNVPIQQQNPGTPKFDLIGTKSEAIQNSSLNPETNTIPSSMNLQPPQQQPQAQTIHQQHVLTSSRGQNYDPIRSSTITAPRSVPTSHPSSPALASPVKQSAKASTSPSIASLINPPTVSIGIPSRPQSALSPARPLPPPLVQQVSAPIDPVPEATNSLPVEMPRPKALTPSTDPAEAMDIDAKPVTISRKTSMSDNSKESPNLSKPKDKVPALTPKLPPLPGQGFATSKTNGTRAIIIDVPILPGERNKYVNFQQLAVEKYGFNTVYPKLALQKDHLARVAANAAALERKAGTTTSNDDMSLDGSDNEAERSIGSKRKATAEAEEPAKKKRLLKEDMYDKDDPFVDDSEMAWEESAAAVKDGFFVYSGPLAPVDGKLEIEKADGTTTKKRSRPSKGGATKAAPSKTTKDKTDEKEKEKKDDDKKDLKPTTNGTKEGSEAKKAATKPAAPRKRATKAETQARKEEKERAAAAKAAASGQTSSTSGTGSTAGPPVPSAKASTSPKSKSAVTAEGSLSTASVLV